MSARQIAALLGHHQGEDDQLTTNQQLVPSLLLPYGHYPQTSTSPFFLQIQNNNVDSFHLLQKLIHVYDHYSYRLTGHLYLPSNH